MKILTIPACIFVTLQAINVTGHDVTYVYGPPAEEKSSSIVTPTTLALLGGAGGSLALAVYQKKRSPATCQGSSSSTLHVNVDPIVKHDLSTPSEPIESTEEIPEAPIAEIDERYANRIDVKKRIPNKPGPRKLAPRVSWGKKYQETPEQTYSEKVPLPSYEQSCAENVAPVMFPRSQALLPGLFDDDDEDDRYSGSQDSTPTLHPQPANLEDPTYDRNKYGVAPPSYEDAIRTSQAVS